MKFIIVFLLTFATFFIVNGLKTSTWYVVKRQNFENWNWVLGFDENGWLSVSDVYVDQEVCFLTLDQLECNGKKNDIFDKRNYNILIRRKNTNVKSGITLDMNGNPRSIQLSKSNVLSAYKVYLLSDTTFTLGYTSFTNKEIQFYYSNEHYKWILRGSTTENPCVFSVTEINSINTLNTNSIATCLNGCLYYQD